MLAFRPVLSSCSVTACRARRAVVPLKGLAVSPRLLRDPLVFEVESSPRLAKLRGSRGAPLRVGRQQRAHVAHAAGVRSSPATAPAHQVTTELQQAKHDLTWLKMELDLRRAPPLTNSE
mgnify:CR=1 FL=1